MQQESARKRPTAGYVRRLGNALAPTPEMRSSGIGWAGGVGRLGGIVFPYLGYLALAASLPLATIMTAAAAPALVIAALMVVLGIVNKGVIGGRAQQRKLAMS